MSVRRAARAIFGGAVALSAGYSVFALLGPSLGQEWGAVAASIAFAATVLLVD